MSAPAGRVRCDDTPGANIGVVELTLLYVIVTGCVSYSWQYSKRKKERRLTREKADA